MTLHRRVSGFLFEGDAPCVLEPRLERSSDGTPIIPPARNTVGVPVFNPITAHTSIPERTHMSIRDENVTTLGGTLLSSYGNRHGSVASDDEYASSERAAESARSRDRTQNEQ